MEPVILDGSMGEGGGQILRTALAFSTISGKPVEIRNIRAGRPNPGLRPQHLTVAQAFKDISEGSLEGGKVGSQKLLFTPGDPMPGSYEFDIGTAGSITLFLQALMPAMVATGGRWSLRVRGGTDTKWSPPWDYFKYVFLHHLDDMGLDALAKLDSRGFYPSGGGEASLLLKPSKLEGMEKTERGALGPVAGRGFLSCLELEVWERLKASLLEKLIDHGKITKEEIVVEHVLGSRDKAIGVVIWAEFEHARLGFDAIGEKGIKAEEVGRAAAEGILLEIEAGSTLDARAADQLLPFMAIAKGPSSFITSTITGHAATNMEVIKKFINTKFQTEEINGSCKIWTEGEG